MLSLFVCVCVCARALFLLCFASGCEMHENKYSNVAADCLQRVFCARLSRFARFCHSVVLKHIEKHAAGLLDACVGAVSFRCARFGVHQLKQKNSHESQDCFRWGWVDRKMPKRSCKHKNARANLAQT